MLHRWYIPKSVTKNPHPNQCEKTTHKEYEIMAAPLYYRRLPYSADKCQLMVNVWAPWIALLPVMDMV